MAIAAPAGWGKSELLTSWEQHRDPSLATAWITLEPGDDAPRRFWRRFLAAVSAGEWAGRAELGQLELAPDGEVAGRQIVQAIVDRVPPDAAPLAIVIDDVHLLAGGESAADLADLLRRRPPSWRLILSGRSLPLPLTRLRISGQLISIGPAELAFDVNEANDLLLDAGCGLSPAELDELVAATGGWAAGLRLAALPLARGVGVDDVLAGIRAGQHDVERYFEEEVISSLPADVAAFLLATCVSPTLDARLARHLSGRDDAAVLLRSLAAAGIFTARDRAAQGTYHYHPLLAESLERHLGVSGPHRRATLHRAAATWHQLHGAPATAFVHAVAGEDWPRCVELIDDLWIPMFVGGDIEGLVGLLDDLPPQLVADDPSLRALRTLGLLDRSDTARIARSAEITARSTRAELVLAIEAARRAGRADVARRAAAAVLDRPAGDTAGAQLRAYVLLSLGVSEYWASDRTAAERHLREALAASEREGLDYLRLGCLSQLVGVLTAQNRVSDAADLASTAAALATRRGWEGSGWAAELWHALGWISYLRGELAIATAYLDRAERSVWHDDAVVGAIIPTIAALVAGLAGRAAQAKALLDLADARLPAEREDYVFLAYIDGELARHAVKAGELRRARELLAGEVAARSLHHCVALAELLVAEDRPDEARRVLRRGLVEADGYLDQRILAMVTLAALEHPGAARPILLEALTLAAPQRIVQPFCQVGAPIIATVADIGRTHRSLRPFAAEVRDRFGEIVAHGAVQQAGGPDDLTAARARGAPTARRPRHPRRDRLPVAHLGQHAQGPRPPRLRQARCELSPCRPGRSRPARPALTARKRNRHRRRAKSPVEGDSLRRNVIDRRRMTSDPVITVAQRAIPVIDIGPYRTGTDTGKAAVAEAVGAACRSVGFLVVTGHGVDPDLVRRLRTVTAQFFELPAHDKQLVAMPPDRYRGYMAEAESLAASYGESSPPDLKESMSIGPVDVPSDDPYFSPAQAGAFFAPNQWPQRPAELAAVWTEYYREMERLATELMRIFALALGLDEHFFDRSVDRHITNMSAIHYPPLAEPPLPGQLRGGPHTDFGSITIVQRDAAPGGLQVLIDGSWIDAPYVEDSFVINLGDLMAEWTNDEWVSTVHRVALPPAIDDATSDRLSFTFFHQPNYDAVIEVIPTCTGPDKPAKYGATTSGAHITAKITAMRSPALDPTGGA